MSEAEIMDRLEVQLPEDIFKDLVEPGKTFGRDVSIGREDSKNSQRPRIGLRLEKMADSLVKIFITTYKPEEDLSNTSMQTDKVDTEHSSIQTEGKKTDTSVSQTDKSGTEESAMQTDKKQEKTQHQQTEKKPDNHKQQQTDKKEEKDQHQQTNHREYKDCSSQTQHKDFTSTECQTIAKAIVEQDSQTDIAEVKSHLSQTDLSMSNMVDGCTQHDTEFSTTASQAVVEMGDCEIQATVMSCDSVVQTVIDTKTASAQAVVDMGSVVLQTELSLFNYSEMCCQTDNEVSTQDCQTDSSMAYLQEVEVQAVVTNSEISQQTELEQSIGCMQTDYLGENIETQTVLDVNHCETQTELVEISMPNIQDGTGAQDSVPEGAGEEPPHITAENPLQTEPLDLPNQNLGIEDGTQTDPVTIIIGDASFLVQKLKSASVNPAKVSGNEIEIEVGYGGDVTQNGGPEMHNTTMSSPHTPLQQHQLAQKVKAQPRSGGQMAMASPPTVNSPGRKAMGRPRKITQSQIDAEKRQQVVGVKQAYVPKPIDVVASFSCPFCEMTFHESPTLYEHITFNHNDAMVKGHKKPKGREGKTIVPRGSPKAGGLQQQQQQQMGSPPYLVPQGVTTSVVTTDQYGRVLHEQVVQQEPQQLQTEGATQEAESEPPVLEPMYNVANVPASAAKQQTYTVTKTAAKKPSKTYTRTVQQQATPSLFEDLPQPTRAYPRNRVKREGNDPDEDEDVVPQPQIDAYEYECPHCPEKYGSASHLYTHLKRSHQDHLEKNKSQDASKKRKRISAVAAAVAASATSQTAEEEPTKKQKMSEDGAEGEGEGVSGPEDHVVEAGEEEEEGAEEEIPTESEMQAEGILTEESQDEMEAGGSESVDEVAEEATENLQPGEDIPKIKAPTRKSVEQAHLASDSPAAGDTSAVATPPQVKRRGRPPKSAKKGSPAVGGNAVAQSSPKVGGKAKRT